jgi:AcrR family transcriptional regulator
MELYAQRGFRGTGLTAIGEKAGVTHAGVLYHYGSSRHLLLAVLDERDKRFGTETADAWSAGPGADPLANLPAVAVWNRENPELAKLYTVLQAENLEEGADAHGYFHARRLRVKALLEFVLQAGVELGEVRDDLDPGEKADEIIAFMEGAQLTSILDDTVDLVGIYRSYTDALMRDLRPGSPPGAPTTTETT